MELKTADLGEYIEKCHYGSCSTDIKDRIFKFGPTHRRPFLQSGRINRVIIFRGSFNPPHRGHEALLRHVFENCQDIDVIAALILPLDDRSLMKKYGTAQFSKKQRVALWRGYGPHDWYWVYDRSLDQGDWPAFHTALVKDVSRDGFDLKFVTVLGPDYVCTAGISNTRHEELIVSDIARPADFVTSQGRPLMQLEGYEPWTAVEVQEVRARGRASEYAAFLKTRMSQMIPCGYQALLKDDPTYFDHIAEHLYSKEVTKTQTVRMCHRTEDLRKTVRFIPSGTDSPPREISATDVRLAIADGTKGVVEKGVPGALREAIRCLALHPDMLVEFCLENARHTYSAALVAWRSAREAQEKEMLLFSRLDREPSCYWPGP